MAFCFVLRSAPGPEIDEGDTMTTSTETVMSAVDELFAVEAIKRVKITYANSADRHDWERFTSVFTPDAVFDESDLPTPLKPYSQEPVDEEIASYLRSFASGVEWPITGRDAILAQHEGVSPDHMMVHHLLNPEIDVVSATEARAMFRFESHHWFPAGGPVHYMHNFGAYHETYAKLDDGRWYIASLRLERRRVEVR